MALLIDFLRYILWMIAKFGFYIMDLVYSVMIDVAAIDIWDIGVTGSSSSIVEQFWDLFVGFTTIAVVVRLGWYLTSSLFKTDKETVGIESIVKRFVMIFVVIFVINLVPTIGRSFSNLNAEFLGAIKGDNNIPSTLVLTTSSREQTGYWTEEGEYVTDDEYDVITVELIDSQTDGINNAQWYDGVVSWFTGGKSYNYFPDIVDLLVLCVLAIYSALLFCLSTVEVAKRIWELIMLIIIGFLPISSLINDGRQFSEWLKMIFCIYFSNFMQVMMILIVLTVLAGLQKVHIWIWIVMLIGGLFFSINGSNKIAQLLGVDTSTTVLQDMANLSLAGRPLIGAGAMAGGAALGLAGAGANATTRLGGKALGGLGKDYGKVQQSTSYSKDYETGSDPKLESMNSPEAFKTALRNVNDNETGGTSQVGSSGSSSDSSGSARSDDYTSQELDTSSELGSEDANTSNPQVADGVQDTYENQALNESPQNYDNAEVSNASIDKGIGKSSYQEALGEVGSQKQIQRKAKAQEKASQKPQTHYSYTQTPLWKENSAGDRFQKWAYQKKGVSGWVSRKGYNALDSAYRRSLERHQGRRYHR